MENSINILVRKRRDRVMIEIPKNLRNTIIFYKAHRLTNRKGNQLDKKFSISLKKNSMK